jgi:hypothetical protein
MFDDGVLFSLGGVWFGFVGWLQASVQRRPIGRAPPGSVVEDKSAAYTYKCPPNEKNGQSFFIKGVTHSSGCFSCSFSRPSLGEFRAGLHPKGLLGFEPAQLILPRGHHAVADLGGGFAMAPT